MTERRHFIRLQKSLECAITIDRQEYPATILDISQEGIAFSIGKDANIKAEDLVVISMTDHYKDGAVFCNDMIGHVKDVSEYEEGLFRCGCHIKDERYSNYVQEQLIASVCGAERK